MKFVVKSQTHHLSRVRTRVKQVMTELSLREDNTYCASQRGGNTAQSIVLMNSRHIITDEHEGVFFREGACHWNAESILKPNHLGTIRDYIDEAFKIRNDNDDDIDIMASLLETVIKGGPNSPIIDTSSNNFIEISKILNGEKIDPSSFRNPKTFLIAMSVAANLARSLDKISAKNNDEYFAVTSTELPQIDYVARFLMQLSPPMTLLVARSMIGIQRLILSGVDDNESWNVLLSALNDRLTAEV